jgi:hypothetical protein
VRLLICRFYGSAQLHFVCGAMQLQSGLEEEK